MQNSRGFRPVACGGRRRRRARRRAVAGAARWLRRQPAQSSDRRRAGDAASARCASALHHRSAAVVRTCAGSEPSCEIHPSTCMQLLYLRRTGCGVQAAAHATRCSHGALFPCSQRQVPDRITHTHASPYIHHGSFIGFSVSSASQRCVFTVKSFISSPWYAMTTYRHAPLPESPPAAATAPSMSTPALRRRSAAWCLRGAESDDRAG